MCEGVLNPKATGSPMLRYRTVLPRASTARASATMFLMAYENRCTREATGMARPVSVACFTWRGPFGPSYTCAGGGLDGGQFDAPETLFTAEKVTTQYLHAEASDAPVPETRRKLLILFTQADGKTIEVGRHPVKVRAMVLRL